MNKLQRMLVAGGCAALMMMGASNVMAQGRGGFDPSQFRDRMLDRVREDMSITNDDEWQVIRPKIEKVFDARMAMRSMEMSGFRRNRGGDDNGGQGRRRGFFGEPSQSIEALRKALDDKAPKDEIKAKLAAVRDEYKQKKATLQAAEDDLRGVLTTRQEAAATCDGLLE